MNHLDWFAPIVVSHHALARFRERIGDELPLEAIRGEIRLALLTGRGSDQQPNWTRGIGRSGPREFHVFYVWDEAVTRCWVIARPRRGHTIVVKSVLAEYDTKNAVAQANLLRTGMTHA